jgi:hypothetical protein
MARRSSCIRFVVSKVDRASHEPTGIFLAGARLRDSGELHPEVEDHLRGLIQWFNKHLDRPERFTRSRRPHRAPKAISWFKSSARAHISKAREIVAVLESHGIPVTTLIIENPGYVAYEDEYQTVAIPFSD